MFVQFSDSTDSGGTAIYRTGTAAALLVNLATDSTGSSDQGWGWQRNAYWLSDTGDVWFQNSGTHTIRVQVREDGVEIDQIVISPVTYATNPPGPVSNDNTIVPKPNQAPAAPGSPSPASGATGIGTTPTLTWTSSGATTYDVRLGTSSTPPPVSTGQTSASFSPGTLSNSTTYFWQVIAHNTVGTTSGPVWSFTTAAAGTTCTDTLTLGYASGTLNIGFTLGTSVAATWNVYVFAQNTLAPLWSMPVPVVSPATPFNVPIPGFPHLGTVYIVTTLGPGTQATCWDVKSIDTGP